MSAFVTLDGVRKQWSHTVSVGPLSLEIPRGEILVLLGPSGSGKTTVLRLLGGFEAPDAGRIVLAGEDVTAVPPARRRCGMVFQHFALFPHLDVGENVAFGLTGRGTNDPKVAEVLALVGLEGFERRRVQALSGGQQQRVALARALAPEPRVLLLDLATADELYEHPASLFVATFVGRANVLRGKTAQVFGAGPGEVLVLRPERLTLADAGVPGVVRERRYTGAAAFYLVEMEPGDRVEVLARPEAARVGDRVYLEAARVLTFPEEQA